MLLVISIILSSYSFALIQVDGPTRTTYNIGDKFPLSGYVQEDTDVSGLLKASVRCKEQEFPLQIVQVSLKAGIQKTFQELGVPQVKISASMNGICFVDMTLVSGNKTYSTGTSKTFEVTKALEGNFLVEEPRVQVGDDVEITGTVLRNDGSGVTGTAEIYFIQDNQKFLVDTASFEDGLFNYTYQTRSIPPGPYSIDIITRDVFGNEMTFVNAANFYLSNKLEVKLRADKAVVFPGETVKLRGEVNTILNKPPESASLEIMLDQTKIPLSLKDGAFEGEIKIPENIKSGKHNLIASAVDSMGNTGNDGVKIEVTPVATKLTVVTDKQKYLPKENFVITAQLFDQGSDLINTFVKFEIYDPEGNKRSSTEVQTNKLETFKIPEFSIPGTWKVKTSIKTLSGETSFVILPIKQIDAKVNAETIYLKNTGNVKHVGAIEINLNKGEQRYQALVRKSILPNETVAVELNNFAPNGEYSITLGLPKDTTTLFDPKTDPLKVSIVNGKKVVNLNILFSLIVAALVFVLLYMAMLKPAPRHKYERMSKYDHGNFGVERSMPKRFVSKTSSSPESSSKQFDEVKDFRDRILRDIKQTEDKVARGFKNKRGGLGGSSSNDSGNAFSSMFS